MVYIILYFLRKGSEILLATYPLAQLVRTQPVKLYTLLVDVSRRKIILVESEKR